MGSGRGDAQVEPVVDGAVGSGDFRERGVIVARTGDRDRAAETKSDEIGVCGQCQRLSHSGSDSRSCPSRARSSARRGPRLRQHTANPRISRGSRLCAVELFEGTTGERQCQVRLTSPADHGRQIGIHGDRVGRVRHQIRVVAHRGFGKGQRLSQMGLVVVVATELPIEPNVDSDCVCEVKAVTGQFGVRRDQLAEDRIGAVEVRKRTTGFAARPGELGVTDQLAGECLRCGIILGVLAEDFLGLAGGASRDLAGELRRTAGDLDVGEGTEAVNQVASEHRVTRPDVQQPFEVSSCLLELRAGGRRMAHPELEVAENRMIGADSFEIIHRVGPILDLLVLDRQSLARPGDSLVEGTVVQTG